MSNQTKQRRVAGIFGTGRSGSTFLGSIVDSHPDVAYRFEPFHRLRRLDGNQLAEQIKAANARDRGVILWHALSPGESQVDKPPFFEKRSRSKSVLSVLYPAARVLPPVNWAYRRIAKARPNDYVIFKEVTHEPFMDQLLESGEIPCVYLIRHPIAVAMSELRAQEAGKMSVGRQGVIDAMLADHRPDLLERYEAKPSTLTLFEKNLLLWRMDTDRAWVSLQQRSNLHLVAYESLCKNLEAEANRLFGFLDLSMHTDVLAYLDSMTSITVENQSKFSVKKNPQHTCNRWTQHVKAVQLQNARTIIEDSPFYVRYVEEGVWKSIPSLERECEA
jgi:hypothetical protein